MSNRVVDSLISILINIIATKKSWNQPIKKQMFQEHLETKQSAINHEEA